MIDYFLWFCSFFFSGLLICFLSALAREKENWLKDREAMTDALRTSQNQVESVSTLADLKLQEAQYLFAQAKLMRAGADRDLVQAIKSIKDLHAKLKAAHEKFQALYAAVAPIIASVCQREDRDLGLGGIIPVLSSRFYDFVKGGFHRCINNVVSYVRIVAPDAPLERITKASVTAEFSRQWEEAKVELSRLSDQILDQMNVLPFSFVFLNRCEKSTFF